MNKKLIAVFLILHFFWLLGAEPRIKDDLNKFIESHQEDIKQKEDEIKILKAQNLLIQSYQDKLINTVYWALGSFSACAVLLLGYNWFASKREYEKDAEMIGMRIKSHSDKIKNEIEEKFTILNKSILRSISEIDGRILSVSQGFLDKKLQFTDDRLKSIQREIKGLMLNIHDLERRNWIEEEVFSNALRCSIEMLNLSIEMNPGFGFSVGRHLDFIKDDLDSFNRKAGYCLDSDLVSRLNNVLSLVEKHHSSNYEVITTLVKKIQAKPSHTL